MRLFTDQYFRFFALGFAGGAALVFGSMGFGPAQLSAPSLVPAAHAAAAQ